MNIAFIVAAALSLLTWAIHTFAGTPQATRPLLESEIEPVAKYTNYYCWHLVTLVLLSMPIGFLYAAVFTDGIELAIFLTVLSASFVVWNLVLLITSKRKMIELPQWTLFLAIVAASIVGLL